MSDPAAPGALDGVVVLELGHGIAGPFATRLLADLGADVIKIEEPGVGDFARRLEPRVVDATGVECSALFEFLNWNKRSVVLDLRDESGRERVRQLAARADIVLECFKPGQLEAWGLGQAVLRAHSPRLVVTSVSSFGQIGPYAGYLGSDLVFQAMSGLMQISGTSDREPLKRGLRQSLYCAGLNAAYASLAAYYASLACGAGAHLDLSILECLSSELVLNHAYYASMGAVQGRRPPQRDPIGGSFGGGDPLPVADGYVSLQTNPQLPIARLAELFDEPRLTQSEFATTEARLEHADALTELLGLHLAGRSGREFFIDASQQGYLTGFVQGAAGLLDCPQLRARGVYHSFAGLPAEGEPLSFPAVLADLSQTPVSIRQRAPRLGEHTGEVMSALGEPEPEPARAARPGRAQLDPQRGPLAGVRVLDLSYVFATPYMGGLLSDLGAEVIKVEAPHRLDQTRSSFSPFFDNEPGDAFWNRAGAFHVVNRGKRSLSLDLGTEAGREVLRALIRTSDVLLENFTPRVMRGWGMTYDELADLNPRLIMLSNTGYGSTGPWAAFRAQGTTLEATMGITQYTGYEGGRPSKAGQSYPDFIACWSGLVAIMAALVHRDHSGGGQWIDLGMYQLGVTVLVDALLRYQATGDDPVRCGDSDLDALFSGVFPAAGEDRWLAVSVSSEAQLQALVALIPGLEAAPVLSRAQLHGFLDSALTAWSLEHEAADAAAQLQAVGVPAGPVLDAGDLLVDPHLRERCFYEWIDCGDGTPRPLIGRPYRWESDATSVAIRGRAPAFGEDNAYVLGEIVGLDEEAIAELYAGGIVTDAPVRMGAFRAADLDVLLDTGALTRMDADYLAANTVGGAST